MRPADSALGIFRSPDPDLCVPGRRILRPREPCYIHVFSINLFNTGMPFMEQINVFLYIKQETEICIYICNRKQTCTCNSKKYVL